MNATQKCSDCARALLCLQRHHHQRIVFPESINYCIARSLVHVQDSTSNAATAWPVAAVIPTHA